MPTGYTAGILDGEITTFPQFAKDCARAFGALMHMRDEPIGSEITPRTPSEYHVDRIKEARLMLVDAETLSDAELVAARRESLEKERVRLIASMERATEGARKMNEILESAMEWQPPTPDHEKVKTFMIDQLRQTIRFDGDISYNKERIAEVESELLNLDPLQIRTEMIKKAKKDLLYHTDKHDEDIKACADANQWVADFMESLN